MHPNINASILLLTSGAKYSLTAQLGVDVDRRVGVGLERHRRAIEAALDDCLLRDRELELFLLTDDAQRRYNFPGLEELQAAGDEP